MPDRLNSVRPLGELLARRAHDHVDDVARDVGPVSPNVCKEFFARHDVTGALHEVVEQIVLAPCQRGDQNLA
jgi:hypothetical protein